MLLSQNCILCISKSPLKKCLIGSPQAKQSHRAKSSWYLKYIFTLLLMHPFFHLLSSIQCCFPERSFKLIHTKVSTTNIEYSVSFYNMYILGENNEQYVKDKTTTPNYLILQYQGAAKRKRFGIREAKTFPVSCAYLMDGHSVSFLRDS